MPIAHEKLKALQPYDCFPVSYPRSGNTLGARRLLYELVVAEQPQEPPPEHVDRLLPDVLLAPWQRPKPRGSRPIA